VFLLLRLITLSGPHTVGRTPLDEGLARCTDLYLTTHIIHKRQISTPPGGIRARNSSMRVALDNWNVTKLYLLNAVTGWPLNMKPCRYISQLHAPSVTGLLSASVCVPIHFFFA